MLDVVVFLSTKLTHILLQANEIQMKDGASGTLAGTYIIPLLYLYH